MHISEAVKKYPELEALLRPQFEEEVWDQMIRFGETSRFLVGVPNPRVHYEAETGKPLTFRKEEEGEEDSHLVGIKTIIYTIKNK